MRTATNRTSHTNIQHFPRIARSASVVTLTPQDVPRVPPSDKRLLEALRAVHEIKYPEEANLRDMRLSERAIPTIKSENDLNDLERTGGKQKQIPGLRYLVHIWFLALSVTAAVLWGLRDNLAV